MMVALAAHGEAPYRTVITHGWTVDGDGHAMHKSRGNSISPNEVADKLGAEILRLWVASSDFKEDVRLSDEILKRLVDAYRKLRNTARYALSNLFDFDPASDRGNKTRMVQKPSALSSSRCRRTNSRKCIGEGLCAAYMNTCRR